MRPLALIDGDIIVYRCGFAGQKNWYYVYYDGEFVTIIKDGKKALNAYLQENPDCTYDTKLVVEPIENVLHSVKQMLNSMLKRVNARGWKIFLSGAHNFREQVGSLAPYKGTRNPEVAAIYGKTVQEKPVHYDDIRSYLLLKWRAEVTYGVEADDALASYQNENTVICSIDKDLQQIPGWHYNFVTDKLICVSPEEATQNLYAQILSGDPVDNIPGLPGIGPAKAYGLVLACRNEAEMEELAISRYVDWMQCLGGNEQDGLDAYEETRTLVELRRGYGFGKTDSARSDSAMAGSS